ncbi:MAG: TRAP transporter large permease [Rhodospirillaceae bacterium]|jgi:tripartite ATP-independent transporter DctM subunit|nr:TRAP transporter large permease [Rhodospirillaceae bacterium]MBT6137563.1 TRAP transporter large permease [Rhodospirillaceae bacterium]
MLLVSMIGLLFVFSLLGMEIAWAIGFACFGYLTLAQFGDSPIPMVLFAQQMTVGVDSFVLLAIPLFIFAGELMNITGVTKRIVRFAASLVSHLNGGLANVSVTANFIMSGTSGSALADAAATGTVLLPEMEKRGFKPAFSSAVIASAATVGPIVPPSISFVLLGAIVNISVGRLFLGGVVPGTLMFIGMFIVTWWICRSRGYPTEEKATGRERVNAFFSGIFALIAPAIIIFSIILGIATPTESSAIAVFYVLFLGFVVYRSITVRQVIEAAGNTAVLCSVIMLTVATSKIFAWIAVRENLGVYLTNGMLAISEELWILLIMINILLLILGMIMEILPIMLILAPILFPLLADMGVDPIHFGVIMVLNLMIGMITPPIGLNLFIMSAIGGVGVMEIAKEAVPYFFVLVGVLLLITYVPELTLYLPNLVFNK